MTGLKDPETYVTLWGWWFDYLLLVDEELIFLCLQHHLLKQQQKSQDTWLQYFVYSTILEYGTNKWGQGVCLASDSKMNEVCLLSKVYIPVKEEMLVL